MKPPRVQGSQFLSDLLFDELVHIDGDTSLTAIVTGFMWRHTGEIGIEVSWLHNGATNSAWFARSRLTRKAGR